MSSREPAVGEEGGLDWILAGELGALLGCGNHALLLTLQAFAVSLGLSKDEARKAAELWLPRYRAHLKERGVANA